MKKLFTSLSIIGFISFIITFQSCSEETTTQSENHAPNIESLSANPSTINTDSQTTLTCIAKDEDGDNLTITWESQQGSFPNGNTGASVSWKAPSNAGSYPSIVKVSDGKLLDQDTITIIVQQSGTAPPSPSLSTPSNASTNVSLPPMLIWNASATATSYGLQVSTSNQFTTTVYENNSIQGTSQEIVGLNNSTTYYWRVNATNSYGTSSYSSVWNFTTEAGSGGGVPCPGLPSITYEGKTYNTVQIGTQCWLRENLDVGTIIDVTQNQANNTIIEKYCYDNDPNNCNTYGGLYQWTEAMQYVTTGGTQGICPSGWHIPTLSELETLKAEVNQDGNTLKAVGQGIGAGAGTNTTGFSALLAGYRVYTGSFSNLGSTIRIFSSTLQGYDSGSYTVYNMSLWSNGSYIPLDGLVWDYEGFSVRCLKD